MGLWVFRALQRAALHATASRGCVLLARLYPSEKSPVNGGGTSCSKCWGVCRSVRVNDPDCRCRQRLGSDEANTNHDLAGLSLPAS